MSILSVPISSRDAYSVEDLPEPVGPHTKMSPNGRFRYSFNIPKSFGNSPIPVKSIWWDSFGSKRSTIFSPQSDGTVDIRIFTS